jgi:hypothetical protein
MELPHIADFAVTKFGGRIFGEGVYVRVGAINCTCRRTIESGQNVQQGALSGTGLPYDGQHRTFADLERQILKEREFRFA